MAVVISMILSYHPMYVGNENRLCAGRDPGPEDRSAMERAGAVILPQGCREPLYWMAAEACPHVFPNYAARFRYPGKVGQAGLFRNQNAPHPETMAFSSAFDFRNRCRRGQCRPPGGFPAVFKLDRGGDGENVLRLDGPVDLETAVSIAERTERDGRPGFLLQRWVPGGNRTLRVAVIGNVYRSYWRVGDDPAEFKAGLADGGRIDFHGRPGLQTVGRKTVADFCRKTGINLAGFDLLFENDRPLFLEINYFFGRKGLGGSAGFYPLLIDAIHRWLRDRGLTPAFQHDVDF
ncbi:MAG: RimK family alpha-L-glutamate ligase [Desulfococcaceae bacterium]